MANEQQTRAAWGPGMRAAGGRGRLIGGVKLQVPVRANSPA